MVNVGDKKKCPECNSIGRVVWISQDKKTMGVRCPSHTVASRQSKFGATVDSPTKTTENVVILTPVG